MVKTKKPTPTPPSWVGVRSISGRRREADPPIDVPGHLRCTKTTPENELDHLEVVRGQLFSEGTPWTGAIVRLDECARGDRVFVEVGKDATAPSYWFLFEVDGT